MNYNKMIDHTLLKPDATKEMIDQIIAEAKEYHFASVCINPTWVSYCAKQLYESDVNVCTVIGFPLGANTMATKVFEAQDAIKNGADEIDMVINIGALKEGNNQLVFDEIKAIVDVAKDKCVKVIIESCLLNDEEIIRVCNLAKKARANFVKTSTGFSIGGATIETVALMKKVVLGELEVKASGEIRNFEDMEKMIASGATRIGTSAGCELVKDGMKKNSNR